MKIAFLDCFSGISGDMFTGALLDLGLEFRALKEALAGLPLSGVRAEARREGRNGIHGTRFLVHVDDAAQPERHFRDIRRILLESGLSERVRERSLAVFQALAEAEARIHDRPVDEVHFHEVGAADSIVDIVSAAFGLEALGVDRLCCSPLPLGSGFVECRHGTIPVPAPATLALLEGVPVKHGGIEAEMVTPTGAALVRVLCEAFGPMPAMQVEGSGFGVGSRDLPDRPNLLRMVIGRDAEAVEADTVALLEANLDDSPPEWTGFLVERLFEAGALDVWLVPVQMKKNRPGVIVQALARPADRDRLAGLILEESTTLGVRHQTLERTTLARFPAEVESPWGPLRVKRAVSPNGRERILPEYEACRRIALDRGIPLREVYAWVLGASRREGLKD